MEPEYGGLPKASAPEGDKTIGMPPFETGKHLARLVLFSFILTFVLTRFLVFLIMLRTIPDFYFYLGGTHIHHLNYGIFLLAAAGAYLLFCQPTGPRLFITGVIYGIGLALTFDEFGM